MRAWFLRWLGIPALEENVASFRSEVTAFKTQIADLRAEVEALKYMRAQREAKAISRPVTDWERIQADFAANPDNFAAPKEN